MGGRRTAWAMMAAMGATVVFVHGMYVTPRCWEKWEPHFRARGYETVAPAWPEHDAPVEEMVRRHPDPRLGALTLAQVVDHFKKVIAGLPTKPFLVGHSMGGLIVQKLLGEGLGAAGVAIDSAPPKGVISLKWSFLKANWPHVSPFGKADEPVRLTFEQFSYAFLNGLPSEAERRAAYDGYAVPESRRVGKGPTTGDGAVDFARARPPLLLIAGERDHIIPPSLNRANASRYPASAGTTDFKEFSGRTHWIIAEEGWQEVADHALAWLGGLGGLAR